MKIYLFLTKQLKEEEEEEEEVKRNQNKTVINIYDTHTKTYIILIHPILVPDDLTVRQLKKKFNFIFNQ